MQLLSKRETPVQNIAYIAIMSAINVIFVLISSFLPILFLLLVFILPLTSVIVTIYCKKYFIPIYAITTIGLCLLVGYGLNIFDTFIYVIPSLITGIVFGFLLEKKLHVLYVLLINTAIQFGLSILTFFVLDKFIGSVSFFNSIYKMVGLGDYQFKAVLTNIFLYITAQIQILITYLLVKYELSRIQFEINLDIEYKFINYLITFFFVGLSVLSYFYFNEYTLVLILFVSPIIIYQIVSLILKRNICVYISLAVAVILFTFIFAVLYPHLMSPNHLISITIFFVMVTIIDFIYNYCLKPKGEKIK